MNSDDFHNRLEERVLSEFKDIHYYRWPKGDKYMYVCMADENINGDHTYTTGVKSNYQTRNEALEGLILDNLEDARIQEIYKEFYVDELQK